MLCDHCGDCYELHVNRRQPMSTDVKAVVIDTENSTRGHARMVQGIADGFFHNRFTSDRSLAPRGQRQPFDLRGCTRQHTQRMLAGSNPRNQFVRQLVEVDAR